MRILPTDYHHVRLLDTKKDGQKDRLKADTKNLLVLYILYDISRLHVQKLAEPF